MDPVRAAPHLLERARRMGPLPYSELGVRASPPEPGDDLDDKFVEWEADALDVWWRESGSPDPYTVVEVGAGDGGRARKLFELGPECLTALRYVLVEESLSAGDAQARNLPMEHPSFLLGPVIPEDPDDPDYSEESRRPMQGIGPLATSLSEVPVLGDFGVVVAVSWLGRLPSDRFEWRDGKWHEVRLAAVGDEFVEILVPLDRERTARADALMNTEPEDGDRFAVLGPAVEWLSRTVRVAESGILAVVDRWTSLTRPLTHAAASPPLALDQLAPVRMPVVAPPEDLFSGLSVVIWALG